MVRQNPHEHQRRKQDREERRADNPGLGARDRALLREGQLIVGIDEVGRGSLAGPVVVGGVSFRRIPVQPDVDDSKRLSPQVRARLADWIRDQAIAWTAVEIWPQLIDRLNILEATRIAMRTAASQLSENGSVVVTDALEIEVHNAECHAPKRADANFFSVAAASIVAKAYRDDLMVKLARRNPIWQWENNKGYGSKFHRLSLDEHGRSYLHRQSFSWTPVLP
ncbi:MAG: ribonuclease HII [bacterium]|nr:ribonuclease HII [bacterium]